MHVFFLLCRENLHANILIKFYFVVVFLYIGLMGSYANYWNSNMPLKLCGAIMKWIKLNKMDHNWVEGYFHTLFGVSFVFHFFFVDENVMGLLHLIKKQIKSIMCHVEIAGNVF